MDASRRFRNKAEYEAWKASAEHKGVAGGRSETLPEIAINGVEPEGHAPAPVPVTGIRDQLAFEPAATGGPRSRSRRRRFWAVAVVAPTAMALAVVVVNYALVAGPVERELRSDARNGSYSLRAHYSYFLDPSTLILDLTDVRSAAPIDLFRGLFQSAKALQAEGRHFDRVVLERSGKPIFVLDGKVFLSTGSEFAAGQNPVYLIRTLPEKLRSPTGEAAFATWEGGLVGVLSKQMEDVNDMARKWALGN